MDIIGRKRPGGRVVAAAQGVPPMGVGRERAVPQHPVPSQLLSAKNGYGGIIASGIIASVIIAEGIFVSAL